MAEDQSGDDRDGYGRAQADAKAAAARAKALRPWYRKKRYILGIPLLTIVGLIVVGALAVGTEDESGPSLQGGQSVGTAQSTAPEGPAGIGDLVKVGSLDLTVISVDASFDSKQHNPFNEANVGVQIRAKNARGDANEEYNLSPWFSMKLVDSNGIAHDPSFVCAGCPDEIGSTDLIRGGSVTGWVYFEIPAGRRLVELLYAPLLSTNKARISLR